MTLKVAYFQPTIIALDQVPPVEFSQIFNLTEQLHGHPELNDSSDPYISIRGGQQIQVYPNNLNLNVSWLVTWLEGMCQGYMELVAQQSGTEDLRLCKPVVTSIWTIRQSAGEYQEFHTHAGGNLSGNIYVTTPEFSEDNLAGAGLLHFRLPQARDVSKFIMTDSWKCTPQAGSMVLFPSHLAHGVYPWRGEGYRTILAFDARLVPKDE